MIKPASGLCNMHCDYCFYCDEAAKRTKASYGLMSPETLKNVLRRCLIPAEGSCMIAFQGGEPTLCGLPFFRSAVEYAAHFNRKGIPVSFALQTNGFAITEEWCRFFAEEDFLIGISVDGTEGIHNRYRHGRNGVTTYSQAMNSIGLFEKHHVKYNILTVVHREIAENIREIYPYYREKGWDYLQFIACLDPLGDRRGLQPYSLQPETYGIFLSELFDLWYAEWKQGHAPFIRQFENYIAILLGYPPESCDQRGTCGIQYLVEADGSVYPCDFYALDPWRLGNFNQDRLAILDEKRKELGFCESSRLLPEKCRICPWAALCRNGCRRNRADPSGADGALNYFCPAYQMFFSHCDSRLREVAARVKSTLPGNPARPSSG